MTEPWYYELFDFVGEQYFSVLNKEKQRKAKKELAVLTKLLNLQAGQQVLDLCCGLGRHAVPLAKNGLRVVGLDASPKLLAQAAQAAATAGVELDLLQGDMREIPFRNRFAVVLNLWNSFGYLEDDADHLKVCQAVANALVPGGKFCLDILNRDWVVRNFEPGEEYREIGDVVEINDYQFDSALGRDVMTTTYMINGVEKKFTHSCRLYTLQEITMLLAKAGLEVREAYGGYNLRPVSLDAKQLLLVAEKS